MRKSFYTPIGLSQFLAGGSSWAHNLGRKRWQRARDYFTDLTMNFQGPHSDFQVVLSTPVWSLNGVNVFISNLAKKLLEWGIPTRVLITRPFQKDFKPFPFDTDLPLEVLPSCNDPSRRIRWQSMIRYLEERSPCIYIPNHDLEFSCVSPRLSDRVGIVGIVHADDPEHYEHVGRLGGYWDAIVAVSKTIQEKVIRQHRNFADRVAFISHGVDYPDQRPRRNRTSDDPLKIVYLGVLKQYQKRVFDIPRIARFLSMQGVSYEMSILGGGPDQRRLAGLCKCFVEEGKMKFFGILPHQEIGAILKRHDVILLTSEFEGMPNALLEAMGNGCVPVVSDVASGIPELIQDRVVGFRVPIGDVVQFAGRLKLLQGSPILQEQMSQASYETIRNNGHDISTMSRKYCDLFQKVMNHKKVRGFNPSESRIPSPPRLSIYRRRKIFCRMRDMLPSMGSRFGRGFIGR